MAREPIGLNRRRRPVDLRDMDARLAGRIREDNRRMHDAAGYAEFYDAQLALMRNPWEQRVLRDDLHRIARRLPTGFRALDLGCGTGNLTLKLLDMGAVVTGVDSSAGMLGRLADKLARRRTTTVERRREDVDEFLGHCGDYFDLVSACSFLHHVPDYVATAERAAWRVAPGGCLYFVHEPLATGHADALGRVLEWVDFRWQRFEARTGLGGRVARRDPYYDPDSLADYWAVGGLDPHVLRRAAAAAGLEGKVTLYDSKRHRLLHVLADWLGTRHLMRLEAWRPE